MATGKVFTRWQRDGGMVTWCEAYTYIGEAVHVLAASGAVKERNEALEAATLQRGRAALDAYLASHAADEARRRAANAARANAEWDEMVRADAARRGIVR